MPEAHTIIAMIATVMLLWGLSVVVRGLGGVPRLRRRARKGASAARPTRPVSIPVTVFGALVAAGSAPVYWTAAQTYRWVRAVDPMVAPFTIWTGVALGCVAFGAGLVAAGYRGDRPKGRKRCPGCWYDMSGAPGLTCPECGREMEGAADLLRPRRNRRMIAAGLALVLLAIVPYYTPRVQRGGWVAAVPTTALILGLPWWPDSAIAGGVIADEDWSLLGRIQEDALAAWQLDLLRSRATESSGSSGRSVAMIALQIEDLAMAQAAISNLLQVATDARTSDLERGEFLKVAAEALSYLHWSDVDTAALVNPHVTGLTALVREDDPYMSSACAQVMGYASELEPATDKLIAMFREPVDEELPAESPHRVVWASPQFSAAPALFAAAPTDPAARESLLDALEGRLSPFHQLATILALQWRDAEFDGLGEAIHARLLDPAMGRYAGALLRRRPEPAAGAAAPVVAAIEADPEPPAHIVDAATYLADPRADPKGEIQRLLDHPSRTVRLKIAIALGQSFRPGENWDSDRLLDALKELHLGVGSEANDEQDDLLYEIDEAIRNVEERVRWHSPPISDPAGR